MYNWVDIVIVTFLIFSVFQAFKEGFISTLVGLFGYIVAFFGAKFYYLEFTKQLETNFKWFAATRLKIHGDIVQSFQSGMMHESGKLTTDPTGGLTLPLNLNQQLAKFFQSMNGATVVDRQADYVAGMIMDAMSFIILFVVLVLIFKLAGIILNAIATLPGLNAINRLAGGLLGLVKGTLVIYALMAALVILSPLASRVGLIQAINGSTAGSFFYNYNVIIYLLGMILK